MDGTEIFAVIDLRDNEGMGSPFILGVFKRVRVADAIVAKLRVAMVSRLGPLSRERVWSTRAARRSTEPSTLSVIRSTTSATSHPLCVRCRAHSHPPFRLVGLRFRIVSYVLCMYVRRPPPAAAAAGAAGCWLLKLWSLCSNGRPPPSRAGNYRDGTVGSVGAVSLGQMTRLEMFEHTG